MTPKARILAIDDQLYFRSFIEGLLTEEGYEVATAESGPAALDLLQREGPFDLVLTDLVMPGMDGVQTVRRICESWPQQAVIVVSGVGDVRAAVAAMKIGAADYLLKPIDREGLVRSIETVLERSRMRDENERLVAENVAMMGTLALFERAVPMFGLARPRAVGEALLELLCQQVRARAGLLWLHDEERGDFISYAAHGSVRLAEEPVRWDGGTEALRRAAESGQPELDVSVEGGALFAPCRAPEGLVAVAALSGLAHANPGPTALAACRKLGEVGALALRNARRREELEASTLRDPETGLLTRAFLEGVARTELRKAQRFGRPAAVLSLKLEPIPAGGEPVDPEDSVRAASLLERVPELLERAVRGTDLVASGGPRQYWVLISDASPLGCVVLKRRIAARLAELAREGSLELDARIGVATYPTDGERFDDLVRVAAERGLADTASQLRTLGVPPDAPLSELAARLLASGSQLPAAFVTEAAQLLLSELELWSADRGLLLVAPGSESGPLLAALSNLPDPPPATQIYLATDGDTLPSQLSLNSLPLPAGIAPETTWLVRFGESPPYALLAGEPQADGTRSVFHSADPSLVELLAYRLRAEVGLGMGS